ncbi:DUF4097 family beta strand repeat-containing protein [Kribbella sp. NPDC026611]|uniref:DUF4097 family beta strand repeat-containing protein n=1 Tax=Kribbella sp. NPDC026611 TaxID=3154911 RepID=UPI0033F05DBA
MTAAQRRMLIIGLVPLLVLVAGGSSLVVSQIRGKLPYSYSSTFAPGSQGVRIEADISTLVMVSVDDQVHVTLDGTYQRAQPDVEVKTVGSQLAVRVNCPDRGCAVDLTVEVPASAAVQAKTAGNSITVVGVDSPLKVDVSDGSIDMSRIRSPQVSVDARRGSVSMLFDDPPTNVSATASEGSIAVQLPMTTTYSIDAVSAQGTADVQVPNDSAATHHLFLRSSYGSITVH